MDTNFIQWLPALGAVITALVIPFAVNICTTTQYSSTTKRVISIVFSILGGVAVGLTTGVPTPETLVMWCLAILGGVQTAYTAFKAIGVTNGWLEALLNVGRVDHDVDDEKQ